MTASPLAQKATDAFNAPICETDPEIAELLDSELGRQRSGLEMIASENFVPRAVLQCQDSVLTNKYAEGYPGRFYHAEAYGVNPETFRTDPDGSSASARSTVPDPCRRLLPTTSRPTASPC